MIGIVLVGHLDLSLRFIEVAEKILGKQQNLSGVDMEMDEPREKMAEKIAHCIDFCLQNCDHRSDSVLILTDLFGSTTTNTALNKVSPCLCPLEVVSGLNLPMLISALVNRGKMSLPELAEKVMTDGKKGIQIAQILREAGGQG